MLLGVPPSSPNPHGQGGMPPYNPHTRLLLIVLSWGYGGVDYEYSALSPTRIFYQLG